MSAFDKNWLALREPADVKARNQPLLQHLVAHLQPVERPTILDIGCGTGSTWRCLSPYLPSGTRWQLLDHDLRLLAEAERLLNGADEVAFCAFDLNHAHDLDLTKFNVVTASALFDLCSADFCDSFSRLLAYGKTALYAALNYNGMMQWSVEHPLDQRVVRDFNIHQHEVKQFGPALGPDAVHFLKMSLERFGYRVDTAPSPWIMGSGDASLQAAFLLGMRQPLYEVGHLTIKEIEDWIQFRLDAVGRDSCSCTVGHTDVLALPLV